MSFEIVKTDSGSRYSGFDGQRHNELLKDGHKVRERG